MILFLEYDFKNMVSQELFQGYDFKNMVSQELFQGYDFKNMVSWFNRNCFKDMILRI